ncbi:MAG: zinc-binding dehydrogenase, partial [Polyangiales bacterium]
MKTRAIALRAFGSAESLEDLDVEIPDVPLPGMIRVRVRAVALNHLDVWVRRGLPGAKLALPHRLGSDVAGVVEAIGAGVEETMVTRAGANVVLAPGVSCGTCVACLAGRDNLCRRYRILGENTNGGYAELLDVPVANVLPMPESLTFVEAAAIPLTFQTAWQMLVDKARVQPGETVLVHAAGSGVSSAAIQIARLFGARVIATTSTEAKAARARELGAHEVIDYVTQDFVAEAKRLTGKRGVDVVIEHVGGEVFARSLLALASGGRLVTCGATSGPQPQIDLRHVFFRQLQILGSTMGSKSVLFPIFDHVRSGALRPIVDRTLPKTADGARVGARVREARAGGGGLYKNTSPPECKEY